MSAGSVTTRIQAYDDGGEVAHVTIERADKLNALSQGQADRLVESLTALHGNAALRAVVLTGAGQRAFMGGADVHELGTLTPATARAFITAIHHICEAIRGCPVPVIARINGYCLGAGMEIAAACDFRIAVESAVFGMPEVRVGLASVVEAALLPTLVGWGRARWLLLTGENIDAAQAERWAFVEQVCAEAALDEAVNTSIEAIRRNAPQATRDQKRLIRRWETLSIDDAVELGIDVFEKSYHGDEPARYTAPFRDRG